MRESLTYETGLREECGVFGMFDLEGGDVARDMYYGLSALQHRGRSHAASQSVTRTVQRALSTATKGWDLSMRYFMRRR